MFASCEGPCIVTQYKEHTERCCFVPKLNLGRAVLLAMDTASDHRVRRGFSLHTFLHLGHILGMHVLIV